MELFQHVIVVKANVHGCIKVLEVDHDISIKNNLLPYRLGDWLL